MYASFIYKCLYFTELRTEPSHSRLRLFFPDQLVDLCCASHWLTPDRVIKYLEFKEWGESKLPQSLCQVLRGWKTEQLQVPQPIHPVTNISY